MPRWFKTVVTSIARITYDLFLKHGGLFQSVIDEVKLRRNSQEAFRKLQEFTPSLILEGSVGGASNRIRVQLEYALVLVYYVPVNILFTKSGSKTGRLLIEFCARHSEIAWS